MRNVIFIAMALLLAASGCITIDMGGGGVNRAPVVVKFTVSPSTIGPGEAAILSWEVQDASSISIDPGIPEAASTGADKVAPMSTTTYILTASNKAGSTRSTALLTVTGTGVTPPAPAAGSPVIVSFSASPSSISPGASSVLSWTTSNATGAKISGIGYVGTSGTTSVNPTYTTTYILEATNGSNSVSASTAVVVSSYAPPPASSSLPTILSFTASPSSVAPGGSTTLAWNTLDATSASIAGFGAVPVNGSLAINTTGTGSITFYLTATNSAGSSNATTTIVSTGGSTPPAPTGSLPTILSFTGSGSLTTGLVTLNWSTLNAAYASISDGAVTQPVSTSGTLTWSGYTGTHTYTLTATNSYGNSSMSTTVAPSGGSTPPPTPSGSIPTASLTISPSTIASGGEATMIWATSGATYAYISDGVSTMTLGSPSGSIAVRPTATTTYTLTARNVYGTNTASQTLTVTATVPYIPYIPPGGAAPTATLYVSQSNIPAGSPTTLSWATSGATSITIDNGVKSLTGVSGASGSITVYPTATTTYTLTATNSYGSTYSARTVTVY